MLKILTRIPNRKLILVDHWMKELPGNYGAVYQDFANDAYEGLGYGLKKLKTCSRFNVVTLPSSLYYASVGKAVERFCRDNGDRPWSSTRRSPPRSSAKRKST